MTSMIFILTTCKNTAEAKRIATMLLRARLVACAKWWPICSSYWWTPLEVARPKALRARFARARLLTGWKGKIVNGKETALLVETLKKNAARTEKAIRRLHSYETPCIVQWRASRVERNYRRWLEEALRV